MMAEIGFSKSLFLQHIRVGKRNVQKRLIGFNSGLHGGAKCLRCLITGGQVLNASEAYSPIVAINDVEIPLKFCTFRFIFRVGVTARG